MSRCDQVQRDGVTRKAKVTEEHLAEARALKAIWDSKPHETQAVFGDVYEIGGQSAVGQFLRGEAPLSMKAAAGFSKGLGVPISSFSGRLAAEAEKLTAAATPSITQLKDHASWPFKNVTPLQYRNFLTDANREAIESMVMQLVKANEATEKHETPAENQRASRSA